MSSQSSPHRGHIICLYGGRAIYVPKRPTVTQTLEDACEAHGLGRDAPAHFAFPQADLAILVEIGALAFNNVRDGAILYLCLGATGPVFPHELAQQVQVGLRERLDSSTGMAGQQRPAQNKAARGRGASSKRTATAPKRAQTSSPEALGHRLGSTSDATPSVKRERSIAEEEGQSQRAISESSAKDEPVSKRTRRHPTTKA